VYAVVAYDGAGHASRPGRVRDVPGSEAGDRAWVDTIAGPAFCGRTGTPRQPRLGCRLLTGSGWRLVTSNRRTSWGDPATRAFVQDANGLTSYCRNLGRSQRTLMCTPLDVARRAWGADVRSSLTPRVAVVDRAWIGTTVGPAQCGRSGTAARPHITCSVLSPAGWQTTTTTRRTPWGAPGSRAFIGTRDGSIAFCRSLGAAGKQHVACTLLHVPTLTWQRDIVAAGRFSSMPDDATWVDAAAGPALCSSPSGKDRGGCRLLTSWGWRTVRLPKGAAAGTARAFVTDQSGRVSWCRVLGHGRTTACTALAADGSAWLSGRSARVVAALGRGSAVNRAWVATSVGPALCGRTGSARQQRVGCQVLTDDGWRFTGSQRTPWGLPGYRAFVPAGSGVAYCRTVGVKRGTAVSCTRMSRLDWGATLTSRRVRMVLPEAF
jgi:hypothetical protein